MCVYTSEAWNTGVVNNTNPQNFLLLYQIGLKLSVGTVLTSRQIRWSPNFSHIIDSDAIGKWGDKGLVSLIASKSGGGGSLFHPWLSEPLLAECCCEVAAIRRASRDRRAVAAVGRR